MKSIILKLETKLKSSIERDIIYNTSFLDKDYSYNSETKEKYKKAAVLCLLDYNNKSFNIILTLRSKNLKNHPGQISFPGGKLNKKENNYDCALRETFEEIGIKKKNINILGELNFYLSGSNFIIKPIVGICSGEYEFILNSKEVDKIFYFPLNFLFKKSNLTKNSYLSKSINQKRFFYDINWKNIRIWGTTALILVHLSRIVNNISI